MDFFEKLRIQIYLVRVKIVLFLPKLYFRIRLKHIDFNLTEVVENQLIYMLCGKSSFNEAIATYISIQRFHHQYFKVIILDDGSLTKKNELKLHGAIKFLKIIKKNYADLLFDEFIKENPELINLKEIRDKLIFGPRLIDIHLIASHKKILQLDTDVLFLNKPYFLLDVFFSQKKEFFYNEDIKSSYSGSIPEIKIASGIQILPCVNAGLSLYESNILNLKFYSEMIKKNIPNYNFYYWEQTLFSLMMSIHSAKSLPNEYDLEFRFKGFNDIEVPSRHYCGGSRIFYYLDFFKKVQNRY
jgi:hypothetical protein